MNKNAETIYIPIGPDLEIKVTLQARYYNGIASDPKTLLREPSMSELMGIAGQIRDRSLQPHPRPTLNYPEA